MPECLNLDDDKNQPKPGSSTRKGYSIRGTRKRVLSRESLK